MHSNIFSTLINAKKTRYLGVLLSYFLVASAFAQNPTQPTDLRHVVYSKTAAEIFWSRSSDNNSVAGYEIQVNGDIIDTRDATSYYANTYVAGTEYTLTVTAIDNEGNRSDPSTVSFIGGNKDDGDDENEPGPEAPASLRASIYSQSTFELFWERDSTQILSYEVFIDSELVDQTVGTSSMQRNLNAGTEYVVGVVAIDEEGMRSSPSTITVTMPGEPDQPVTGPPAPGNALLTVYSRTTAELFWDRAPASAAVVNNEIKRDGELIGQTNGISFYDDTRIAEFDHEYEITAIDASGLRSVATVVTGGDDGDGDDLSVFVPDESDIVDIDSFYDEDGYDTVDVIRLDVRTETNEGICTIEDLSGCTLDDVIADTNPDDDFKVDIAVHVQGEDLPDDGSQSNALLRQRGGSSRQFPQKSFRIKLDSKENLWRNERRLQLNKHPNERARIRNKLSFDLMRELPHLPSLRTQFVNLWIDDGAGPEDYGLFTHVEFFGKEYLVNRDLNDDDRVYKAEFLQFSQGDLDNLQVDENGEPLDEDRFESRLQIERGKDHTNLVNMLTDFVDPDKSFEAVFDKYFNENNVLTWITTNFLLYQTDAITQNFYLYNPVGSEKFYFLPWDYDGTFHPDSVLTNSYDSDALSKRLYYGYARGVNNAFISEYYKRPGAHEKIVAAANELRNTYLTDSNIAERAERYARVVEPFLLRSPDIDNNPSYSTNSTDDFVDYVSSIHSALQTSYDIPMPPTLQDPVVNDDKATFSWTPAYDVTRSNTLSYTLEVSDSIDFEPGNILRSDEGITDDAELITHTIDADLLPSGTLYVRVTARGDSDPLNVWQVARNFINRDGKTWYGIVEFNNP